MLRTALVPAAGIAAVALLLSASVFAQQMGPYFPSPERLSYRVEWHLITAGIATVELTHGGSQETNPDWRINLTLESTGTVARLYHLLDKYHVVTDRDFCPSESQLDAEQGKRHRITQLAFDNAARKVTMTERDLVKNSTQTKDLKIVPCTHDILGALAILRTTKMAPGEWKSVPVTNGKKMAFVKIHAQSRETIKVEGKTYQTIRYEAYLFNNALYKRKGRLLMWLTDDGDRIPVQFRFQLGFPIGTVSVELEKREAFVGHAFGPDQPSRQGALASR